MHVPPFITILDKYKIIGTYERINTIVTIHELFTDQKEDWYLKYQAPWMIVMLIFIEELQVPTSHICHNHLRYVAERWRGSAFKNKEFVSDFINACSALVTKVDKELALLNQKQLECHRNIDEHVKFETGFPLGFEYEKT
jgi:hypothetical protein